MTRQGWRPTSVPAAGSAGPGGGQGGTQSPGVQCSPADGARPSATRSLIRLFRAVAAFSVSPNKPRSLRRASCRAVLEQEHSGQQSSVATSRLTGAASAWPAALRTPTGLVFLQLPDCERRWTRCLQGASPESAAANSTPTSLCHSLPDPQALPFRRHLLKGQPPACHQPTGTRVWRDLLLTGPGASLHPISQLGLL